MGDYQSKATWDYWATRGLDIPVPSFGQLSDRFANLDISVRQRCQRLAKRLADGEAVDLFIDSTGMSFGRASQWYEVKYGTRPNRTPWRKMHLAIDPAMNVHGIAITDTAVSDSEGMDLVMPVQTPIAKAIADGAYYSIERAPPSHAVVHGKDNTTWHDALGKRSAIPS